jgi:hypothetical protein
MSDLHTRLGIPALIGGVYLALLIGSLGAVGALPRLSNRPEQFPPRCRGPAFGEYEAVDRRRMTAVPAAMQGR